MAKLSVADGTGTVFEKAKLHVLSSKRNLGIVLFLVAPDLGPPLRTNFQPATLRQWVKCRAVVEVVVELTVHADSGKGPAIDEALFPEMAQPAMGARPIANLLNKSQSGIEGSPSKFVIAK